MIQIEMLAHGKQDVMMTMTKDFQKELLEESLAPPFACLAKWASYWVAAVGAAHLACLETSATY